MSTVSAYQHIIADVDVIALDAMERRTATIEPVGKEWLAAASASFVSAFEQRYLNAIRRPIQMDFPRCRLRVHSGD